MQVLPRPRGADVLATRYKTPGQIGPLIDSVRRKNTTPPVLRSGRLDQQHHNLPLPLPAGAAEMDARSRRCDHDAWGTEEEHKGLVDRILTEETGLRVDDWVKLVAAVG